MDPYTIGGENDSTLTANSIDIPEGAYEIEARVSIEGCSDSIDFRNREMVICPKNINNCPGVRVLDATADRDAVARFVIQFDNPEYVRQNGFVMDFGDGSATVTVTPEQARSEMNGDTIIVNHQYPRDGVFEFNVSFPEFGPDSDCQGGTSITISTPPPPGGGGGGGCDWWDLTCWNLCAFLGRLLALAIAALLLLISIDGLGFLGAIVARALNWIVPGADFAADSGVTVGVASGLILALVFGYLALCGECNLARYTVMAVTLFVIAFIITLIATGAATLGGSVAAIALATGMFFGAQAVLRRCD